MTPEQKIEAWKRDLDVAYIEKLHKDLDDMLAEVAMTPEQKIENVEKQIGACMRGATNVITCPYCGTQTWQANKSLCCADLGLTVWAILNRQAQQERIEHAERIAEMFTRN